MITKRFWQVAILATICGSALLAEHASAGC
jgi:hypothetical protein